MAGAVGEDGGGIPGAAAFFAHEGEVPDIFFDVGDEGGFDLEEGAGVEADLADGEVFDGVGFVIPVGPAAGGFGGFISHICPCVSGGGDGFGGAHEVVGHFDHVDADVDHGAAALKGLLAEDAPIGDAAAAEGLALHEHNFAEFAFIAGLDQELRAGVEAVLEADGEFFLFLRGGVDEFLAFFGEHCHGLFGGGVGGRR